MKKQILRICAIIAACLFTQTGINAQTLVPPSMTDILWVPGGGATGINTALIDFPCFIDNATCSNIHPWIQLGACAYNGGAGGVVVTDFSSGFPVNILYPVAGNSMASVPDVILGNKIGSSTDFIMAVAFVNNALPAAIEVDYFDIHYTAPGVFMVTYNSSSYVPAALARGTVHIDVVAASTSLTPYGLPLCDRFFITYDFGSAQVYACYGNLNTYSLTAGPVTLPFAAYPSVDGWQPDVAGIEREIPPLSGMIYDVACVTYLGSGDDFVYYQEWVPGLTVYPYSWLDIGPYNTFSHPRIDANDDWHTNGTGMCQSKVVCEYLNPIPFPHIDVNIYSPTLFGGISGSAWIDLSITLPPAGTWPTPYYNNMAPAVAYGPNGGTEYMVTECANAPSIIPGDFFIMSPINSICASGLAPAPSSALDYFEVNLLYPATSSNYANAVSTPCNNVSDTSLVAWTNSGTIWYKRSGFAGPSGYAYKTQPAAVPADSKVGMLTIFPNPSNDNLSVSNPASTNADQYNIKNILGQPVMSGSLKEGDQHLDISSLANGTYIISAYRDDALVSHTVFVKK